MPYHRGGQAGAVAVSYSSATNSIAPLSSQTLKKYGSTSSSGSSSSSSYSSRHTSGATSMLDRNTYTTPSSSAAAAAAARRSYGGTTRSLSSSYPDGASSLSPSVSSSSRYLSSSVGAYSTYTPLLGSGGINGGASSKVGAATATAGSVATAAADLHQRYSPSHYVPKIHSTPVTSSTDYYTTTGDVSGHHAAFDDRRRPGSSLSSNSSSNSSLTSLSRWTPRPTRTSLSAPYVGEELAASQPLEVTSPTINSTHTTQFPINDVCNNNNDHHTQKNIIVINNPRRTDVQLLHHHHALTATTTTTTDKDNDEHSTTNNNESFIVNHAYNATTTTTTTTTTITTTTNNCGDYTDDGATTVNNPRRRREFNVVNDDEQLCDVVELSDNQHSDDVVNPSTSRSPTGGGGAGGRESPERQYHHLLPRNVNVMEDNDVEDVEDVGRHANINDIDETFSGRSGRSRLHSDERCGLNGLRNIGNTCFMNSVIQCLSNTKPLLEYLLNEKYLADINSTSSSMKGALIKAFAKVIQELWESGSESVVNTSSFKSQIQRFAPRFMGYSQQDAQEFLRYLLEGLHEDVNRVVTKPTPITIDIPDTLTDSQKATESWKRYLRSEDSMIVDIFVGQLRSSLRCTFCDHVSVTLDPFWDLSLPIPTKSGTVKLSQCLEHFTKEEVMDGDEKPTCSKCQMRRKCTKSFSIQKFPKILVIHLKRFSPMERFRGKLNVLVDFPLTGLDLSAFAAQRGQGCTYNLYGVANHSGTTYSGHYTAYCKHPYSNEWHEYNDSRVSDVPSRSVASCEGYVLFYEQQPHTSHL